MGIVLHRFTTNVCFNYPAKVVIFLSMKRKELIKSETKSIYMANFFSGIVSVLSALIIGTALSSIDYEEINQFQHI